MPKAFVTGATGFIGGALLRELLHRNWDVRVLIRPTSDTRNLEGHARRFERVTGDLRDPRALRDLMNGCEVLFHVAARYSLSNPAPDEIYRDNVDGTRNVLMAAADAGVRRIVYTSTVGVFRPPLDGELAHESQVALEAEVRGHYKRSKHLAEACAMDLAAKGAPIVVVNPSTPIGPHDIKPTPTGRMILDFLNGRMFAFTNTGLNLVAVEDVARGHILAAEQGVAGERYILGAENYSLKQLFDALARLTGLPAPRVCLPRRLLYPLSLVSCCAARLLRKPPLVPWEAACMAQRYMYFDSGRARKELGFSPGDVREALWRAIRWFQDNGYARLPPTRRAAMESAGAI